MTLETGKIAAVADVLPTSKVQSGITTNVVVLDYNVLVSKDEILEVGAVLTSTAFTSGNALLTVSYTDNNNTVVTFNIVTRGSLGQSRGTSLSLHAKAGTVVSFALTGTWVQTLTAVCWVRKLEKDL